MAKLFDTADAERLIQEHRMMLEELDEIAQYEDNVQIDIEKAANLVVTRNVLDVLRDIPVEEINREKGGFRVKALRDHGFRSIADIVAANVYSISSVHGISEDAAYSIKRIANDMADKVREGAKIKLNVDNKTRESTALVTALSKYGYARETAKECRGLITENRRQIEYAIEDLLLSQKRLKWIFASSAKKQKAVDAYEFLDSYRNGNYGQRVREQRTIFENTKRINGIDAWKEFSEHSVSFFNALENIVPGTLGNLEATIQAAFDKAFHDAGVSLPETIIKQNKVPQGWTDATVGDFASVQTGPFGSQLHNEDYVESGTPIITVEHMDGKYIAHRNLPLVSQNDVDRLRKYDLHTGDIVFSRVGSVDRAVMVSQHEDGWLFSGRCLRVRPYDPNTGSYFLWWFNQPVIRQLVTASAVGATMPSINTSILNSIRIVFPQKDIVTQFCKMADGLIEIIATNLEEIRKLNDAREYIQLSLSR